MTGLVLLICCAAVYGEDITTRAVGFVRVELKEGHNYIAPPLHQPNHTVAEYFGINLPAGPTESTATIVEAWDHDNQQLDQRYWLSSAPGFTGWNTNGFTSAGHSLLNPNRGFRVTVREGAGDMTLFFTGTVPEASAIQTVHSNGYTLVQSGFPANIPLAESALVASGFTGGAHLLESDWVVFFNTENKTFNEIVWYDAETAVWRNADRSVSTRLLQPGEAFLIRRQQRPGNFVWALPRPYTLP